MKFKTLSLLLVALTVQVHAATVIDFEDIASGTNLSATNYAGLTWGTSTLQSESGLTGSLEVYDDAIYAQAASGTNYVYNGWGAQDLWFDFGTQVAVFKGAYVAKAGAVNWPNATELRFRDDLGNISGWHSITESPAFLAADFVGSTRIFVEYNGTGPQQYTLDDITYEAVPEPMTMSLLGLTALAALRRRKKA